MQNTLIENKPKIGILKQNAFKGNLFLVYLSFEFATLFLTIKLNLNCAWSENQNTLFLEYCETRAVPNLEDSEYLTTLGTKLHPRIEVLWTGVLNLSLVRT